MAYLFSRATGKNGTEYEMKEKGGKGGKKRVKERKTLKKPARIEKYP